MTTLFVYMDGSDTPTYWLDANVSWRPEKGDISWRIEDRFGHVIDEYHPRHSVKGSPMLILKVKLRSVYGRHAIYPVNDAAAGLAAVAGTATLTPSVLNIAKAQLGAAVLVEEGDADRVAELMKAAA
jgi:hypothetical protein